MNTLVAKNEEVVLTEMQQRFADIYIETAGKNGAECARLAGYSTASDGHRVTACNLLKNPKVLAYIRQQVELKAQASLVHAWEGMTQLAAGNLAHMNSDGGIDFAPGEVKDSVRLAAYKELMDRAGWMLIKTQKVDHNINVNPMSNDQRFVRLGELAKTNPKVKALVKDIFGGMVQDAVDAEFEEIDPNEPVVFVEDWELMGDE